MKKDYILATGEKGAERLNIVQLIYGGESKFLLKKAGLKKGMVVMDAGCGTGLMTKWLAEEVGETGHIVAVDNQENQLELAKKYLDENKIYNVSFHCRNINELSANDLSSIDLFYSRLLLVHNKNPLSVIKNIYTHCNKNTRFVFEEPITSESECIPENDSFLKHLELYTQLGRIAGFDFDFGKQLPLLVKQAGLAIEGIRKIKNLFLDDSIKRIAYLRTKECAEKYINNQLINQEEISQLLTSLQALANRKNLLVSGVTMVQIWGSVP